MCLKAVGSGVSFLKLGGLRGGERMDKYNRLMAIEEELEQEGNLGTILLFTHSHTHIMETAISSIYIQCIVPLCLAGAREKKQSLSDLSEAFNSGSGCDFVTVSTK